MPHINVFIKIPVYYFDKYKDVPFNVGHIYNKNVREQQSGESVSISKYDYTDYSKLYIKYNDNNISLLDIASAIRIDSSYFEPSIFGFTNKIVAKLDFEYIIKKLNLLLKDFTEQAAYPETRLSLDEYNKLIANFEEITKEDEITISRKNNEN